MTFSIFFSTINFSYQYLSEAKAYLEPSPTFYNGAFSRNIFFPKFIRKHLCWSVILMKLQVSILQIHWKKVLQHRCFLVNFARYLRHFFTEHLQVTISVLRKKCFINKIVKNPPIKRKKMETACKKNNHTGKTKT